ncbi:hypothetical protein HG15A2_24940 [Adhaeretor mobilis]|uniref:Uncharacterized protein n=1 Tax=Adhaeretor mobilis TaxID=1930276 RepID=A0A517MWF1_9BACT|nr:hypothetical protein HG15A2_24940 [Adhaeretor mobilis]
MWSTPGTTALSVYSCPEGEPLPPRQLASLVSEEFEDATLDGRFLHVVFTSYNDFESKNLNRLCNPRHDLAGRNQLEVHSLQRPCCSLIVQSHQIHWRNRLLLIAAILHKPASMAVDGSGTGVALDISVWLPY